MPHVGKHGATSPGMAQAGDRARIQRVGATVHRPREFWSPAVHDLLRHLEQVGFPAPRVVGSVGGTEILTWIEGESGAAGWAKVVPLEGLSRWGRFLKTYHDAVADYRPAADAAWSAQTSGVASGEIVCHGDFGPWNGVWQGDRVVGLIDWDHARPAAPLFDVAYALLYVAPFCDDREAMEWRRYPSPPDRRERIQVFCEAYGMPAPRNAARLVAQHQRTVLKTTEELARRGIEPLATWVRDGYLETVRARIRWTEAQDL